MRISLGFGVPRYRPGPAPLAPSRGGARSPRPLRDESPARIPSPAISMAWPGVLPGLLRAYLPALSGGPAADSASRRAPPFLRSPRPSVGPAAGPRSGRFGGPTRDPPGAVGPARVKPFPVFSLLAGPAGRGCAPRPALEACVRARAGVIDLNIPKLASDFSGPLAPAPRRRRSSTPALRFVFPLVPDEHRGGAGVARATRVLRAASRALLVVRLLPGWPATSVAPLEGVGPLPGFLVLDREFPSRRRLRSRRLGARLPSSTCFGRKFSRGRRP